MRVTEGHQVTNCKERFMFIRSIEGRIQNPGMRRHGAVRGSGDHDPDRSYDRSNTMFLHLRKALFLLAFVTSTSQAAVVGEVIAAHNQWGRYVVMSASNGGQFAEVNCGLDLTHGGSPRYFLGAVANGIEFPDGNQMSELMATDEECALGIVISDEQNVQFSSTPHWSPDGEKIAVWLRRWDPALNQFDESESGLYLADVEHDSTGRPVRATNLRLLIPSVGEFLMSWSGDGQRIAYVARAPSSTGGSQADIFVYDLNSGTSVNVTNTPDSNEDHPAFSPIGDRIAFIRVVDVRGSYLYDIFTIPAWGGAEIRVTTKKTTGSPANMFPCFSPDGQYLSFSSGSLVAPIKDFDIYKIKADGSGKATNLTSKRSGSFRYQVWRK
jgi:hypothetical protein